MTGLFVKYILNNNLKNNHLLEKIKELESKNLALSNSYSKLKKVENELKNSGKRYRLLFEFANDAIFIMDQKEFIDCNKKTLKIFGCDKKSDIVGHTPIEFSPQKQADGESSKTKAIGYIKAAFDGKTQEFDWTHSKKNGELFEAEVSLKKIVLDDKQYLQALVRDVSEKKRLLESEEKFKIIVTNAQAIIFMLDKKGNFLLSEGQGLKKLGLKPGEVVGLSALDLYKDNPQIIKGIKTALIGKYSQVVTLVGDTYFDTFYSPYENNYGEIIGVIGMATDVTERERANVKLMEIDKIKTEFLTTASHQLRSPLGGIRWNLENILSNPELTQHADCKVKLDDVYASTLRLIDLINDLLDISHIEQKKFEFVVEKFDLRNIIDEIEKELHSEIKRKKIKFVFVKPAKKVMVELDKKITREVMQNLISNAIKYNEINGQILLVLKNENRAVSVEIANTGIILSKKDQERVFEKFFRSEKAIRSEADGSGLGLFVAKSYVEQWGGKVSFVSPKKFGLKNMDGDKFVGTLFSVELPLSLKKNNKK